MAGTHPRLSIARSQWRQTDPSQEKQSRRGRGATRLLTSRHHNKDPLVSHSHRSTCQTPQNGEDCSSLGHNSVSPIAPVLLLLSLTHTGMWSSEQGSSVINNKKHKAFSSSTSSSTLPSTTRRNMKEVWKDINLATPPLPLHFQHHRSSNPSSSTSFREVVFQDFLAVAIKERSAPDEMPLPPPPLPPPSLHDQQWAPALSLNSGQDVHKVDYSMTHQRNTSSNSNSNGSNPNDFPRNESDGSFISAAAYADDIDGFPSPGGLFYYCPKKRALEQQIQKGLANGGGDRRQKRMMKNRESAARSRARKQAYTHELEQEVQHLAKENEMLKKQREELRTAMASQLPANKKIQRCKTAPF